MTTTKAVRDLTPGDTIRVRTRTNMDAWWDGRGAVEYAADGDQTTTVESVRRSMFRRDTEAGLLLVMLSAGITSPWPADMIVEIASP